MASTWVNCWETNDCWRVRDVGQLVEHRVFLLFAAQHTLLATLKGRAVLLAGERVFCVMQQELPSNWPLCSN